MVATSIVRQQLLSKIWNGSTESSVCVWRDMVFGVRHANVLAKSSSYLSVVEVEKSRTSLGLCLSFCFSCSFNDPILYQSGSYANSSYIQSVIISNYVIVRALWNFKFLLIFFLLLKVNGFSYENWQFFKLLLFTNLLPNIPLHNRDFTWLDF